MKIVKTALVVGGLFLTGRYLLSLNRAGKKIAVDVGGRIHKIAIEGVVIVLKYNIKNPTTSSIKMAAPLVKLSYNGKVLASSSMALVEIPENARTDDGRIKIDPHSETGFITTNIIVPYLSLLGAGANLILRLKDSMNGRSDNPVKFEIESNSTVYTKVGNYPYDDTVSIEV